VENSGLSVAKGSPHEEEKDNFRIGICYNDQEKKKLRKLLTTIL
jgi:hypothetical protein